MSRARSLARDLGKVVVFTAANGVAALVLFVVAQTVAGIPEPDHRHFDAAKLWAGLIFVTGVAAAAWSNRAKR